MAQKVIALNIKPGIQRDGTRFDNPVFDGGEWVRFQRGRPRKIGGYRGIFQNASGISRGMIMGSLNGINNVYSGSASGLQQWVTDNDDGVGAGPADIVLSDFTPSEKNLWQFDMGFDTGGGEQQTLVAHAGLNLDHIDNTQGTPVLIGNFPGGAMSAVKDVGGTDPTGETISVSGGCVFLYPYLFVYGSNGLIKNSSAGNFQDWNGADSNENNVCGTKVVRGMPIRGGTTSPSGLFWSLDSLVRVSYAPISVGASTTYWRYDTISAQTSILSSNSVIEYDGMFFWCGVDRFLMYSGVVQELPNQININHFFDNLNYAQRQKIWATKVPRWGEIWWFYPRGDATECTDAIIFNVRDKVWYDAGEAIGARRSAGTFSEVFRKPIWAGNAIDDGKTIIWQHETGSNQVNLNSETSVRSFFETNSIGWVNGGPGQDEAQGMNRYIRLERVEPDFVQSGDMSITVLGKGYASGDSEQASNPYHFSPETDKVDVREQRREMRLRFESNVLNGNYETGQILLSVEVGDERSTGRP
jgi:hypothetical protein